MRKKSKYCSMFFSLAFHHAKLSSSILSQL